MRAKKVLRAYGLLPEDGTSATDYDNDRLYFNNQADERLFGSGGSYGVGTTAGVGYSYGVTSSRTNAGVNVGFRSAYYEAP